MFSSNRAGDAGLSDLWIAQREVRTDGFAAPVGLSELNTADDDTGWTRARLGARFIWPQVGAEARAGGHSMSSADEHHPRWYPVRSQAAFWARVGATADEVVVMLEGDTPVSEVRAFLVRGNLAVAWWSRMDGASGHDAGSLIARAADSCGLSESDCAVLFDEFWARLVEARLVCPSEDQAPAEMDSPEHAPTPFPNLPPARPVEEFCSPLHLESFVQQDLVALGTFFGGQSNVSGSWPCRSQVGGEGNTVSTTACRPGQGYGLINAGWVPPVCGG